MVLSLLNLLNASAVNLYKPEILSFGEKRIRTWCCKISNKVGKNCSFRALARKLPFLPTESDNFDVRQHYVRILFIFQCSIC